LGGLEVIEATEMDRYEKNLLQAARRFEYPRTPDLVSSLRHPIATRRMSFAWRYAVIALLITFAALLAVPEVRAAVLEFLRIGAVQIEVPAADETPSAVPTQDLIDDLSQQIAVSDLSGETTLEQARESVNFMVPLPAYPASLDDPDHVFLQSIEEGRNFVIVVWMDSQEPRVDLALYVIGPGITLTKGPVDELLATSVNGQPAAYVRGAHYLQTLDPPDYGVLVSAPALIWEADGITYRIEADLPVEELVRIAESLSE
jgi:hypothetical protein